MALQRRRIRLECDARATTQVKDVFTGASPDGWNSNDTQIEVAIFDAEQLVTDISNIESLTLAINDATDRKTAVITPITVAAADLDGDVTVETWEAGTAQHALIPLTNAQFNFDLDGATSKSFWLVVYVTTTDVPARTYTVGTSILRILEDGAPPVGSPDPGDPLFLDAGQSDARYFPLADAVEEPDAGQVPTVRTDTGRIEYSVTPRHVPGRTRKMMAKIQGILSTSPVGRINVVTWGDSVATLLWDQLQTGLQSSFGNSGLGMSALIIALGGGASSVTGAYGFWVTGNYYSVPVAGTVTWSGASSGMTTLDVYYVAEPGAGEFKIQSSPDGSSWTDELTVDADNVATIGAYATVAKTAGTYQLRVVGFSGTVKIVGGAILTTANGIAFFPIARPGIALVDMNSTPTAILTPILARIAPDLISLEMKDSAAAFEIQLPIVQARWEAALANCDYLYCGSNPVNPATQDDVDQLAADAVMERHAVASGALFFDGRAVYGSYAVIAANSWSADGVHINAAGAYYCSRALARYLGLFDWIVSASAGRLDRVALEGCPIGQTTRAAGAFTSLAVTTPIPKASGGTGLTSRPVAAYRKTVNRVMVSAADEVLTIDESDGDADGIWDGTTFTAPRAGWVQLTAAISADAADWYLRWVRGGTEYIQSGQTTLAAGTWVLVVYVNAAETMQLKAQQSSGSDKTIYGSYSTRISISYID